LGIGVAVASVALGATLIENHLTLRRSDGGVDSAFSLEPEEMQSLVTESERAWHSLGKVTYGTTPGEAATLVFRRSLYVTKELREGDVLSSENMRAIRPGNGLSPKFYDVLVGKQVNCPVRKGTPITWSLVK
ncbi:MAG: N-acetylneuraminate synthase family protein, partial [Acidobacteria bacterium]|nr:N-acetylneuraminate synthase family protein [Acidobacteriota bacterium]